MNLQISPWQVVGPRMVLTLGLGLLFAPISVAAYKYTPAHLRGAAVGLLSLLRTEGGSVGTSMASTIQERREQFHLSRLGEHLGPLNPHVRAFLDQARELFMQRTGDPARSQQMACRRSTSLRQQQAAVARLLRRLLAVRRPGGGARRSGAADEALGGREGRAHRRGVALRWRGQSNPTLAFQAPTLLPEMRETGLEPARPCGHQALNLARLPIPPFPQKQSVSYPV